jgi:hypothetical protein
MRQHLHNNILVAALQLAQVQQRSRGRVLQAATRSRDNAESAAPQHVDPAARFDLPLAIALAAGLVSLCCGSLHNTAAGVNHMLFKVNAIVIMHDVAGSRHDVARYRHRQLQSYLVHSTLLPLSSMHTLMCTMAVIVI